MLRRWNNAAKRLLLMAVVTASAVGTQSAVFAEEAAERVGRLAHSSTDWPWWRGPSRNGTAYPDQRPPLQFDDTHHVIWKMPVPGRGHGSPTVVGEHVYLAVAEPEDQVQSVMCFQRSDGKVQWKTELHRGGFPTKGNTKASLASGSVACDGERLFINFLNDGAVWTSALTTSGEKLWQTRITDYVIHQGYGSSPALYENLVLVSADNKGGGAIAALNRDNGEFVWKHTRPSVPNYASPIILSTSGKDQLVFQGCDLVSSYDPTSGKKLWEVAGATTECVTSTVTDGKLIYTSGGYPRNHLAAVKTDGSGQIAWENKTRVYVPSMVIHDGALFATADAGVAMCWDAATGEELWKQRLGGTFSASPVLVGDQIFATNEAGETTVFRASRKGFEKLGSGKLGSDVFATPAICGDRIYHRVGQQEGERRQEYLYCIGNAE